MKLYETEPSRPTPSDKSPILPVLEDAQRIEGSGPLRSVKTEQLPTWLRFFKYGITGIGILMIILVLFVSVFK